MPVQKLIAVKEFCSYHQVDTGLVISFHNYDLIELVKIKRTVYIPEKSLPTLEKIIRLYQELHINPEGIQAVLYLLQNIEKKETELQMLRNRLDFFTTN